MINYAFLIAVLAVLALAILVVTFCMINYAFLIAVLAVLALAILVVTFCNYELNNEQYDRLKNLVMKWPAILTFLGVLVATFHFSFGEETITVVAAIGALLARILNVSNYNYNDSGAVIESEAGWVEDDDIIEEKIDE